MKKAIAISVAALLLNSAGVLTLAQTVRPASEKEFTATYDAQICKTLESFPDLPGIAIVLIKDDRPIFVRAYGMADREAGVKADADTLFYIGSSTKSFTALAAAMLDQEGKIKFSDSVTKYTQGIRFKNEIPDKITIRDLLTHTSGLRKTRRSSTGSLFRARSTSARSITCSRKAPLLMRLILASTLTQISATTFTGSRCITN